MSAKEGPEVKVRLVVDSNSQAVTNGMKKDLGGVESKAAKSSKGMASKLGAGMVATGMLMAGALKAVAAEAMHLGKEALIAPIEAFLEADKSVRQLTSTLSMLDDSQMPFEQMKIFAGQTKDELEDLGMQIGVTDDALVEVFTNVIERGGKSVEEAKKLTEQMALAGRAIPGGAIKLSEAFEQIQMGATKAKNPIVGMISATGLLKGSAKEVAKQMQAMSIEEQMKLAEKAVGGMSEKMKSMPMTLEESVTSMKVMFGNLLEGAGEPMVKALSQGVNEIRGAFFEDSGEQTELSKGLAEGAKTFGNAMSKGVAVLAPFVTSFITGISEFGEEFKFIWSEVWGEGDGMMKQLKEVAIFAGKFLGGSFKMVGVLVGTAVKIVQYVLKQITASIGWLIRATGDLTGSSTLSAAGQKTMNFAYQAETDDILAKAKKTGGGEKRDLIAQMEDVADATGDRSRLDDLRRAFQEREEMVIQVDAAQKLAAEQSGVNAAQYIAVYGNAAKAHDDAAMLNIARFLGSNQKMAEAIGKLAPDMIEGGVAGFADMLEKAGNKEMAAVVRGGQKDKLEKGIKPTVNQTFTGAINIKQDFKDEDPDRVVAVFREALANAGTRPLSARGLSPFG